MKNFMLGNLRKVTSGLDLIAVTCIKLVVEAFLESCRICVSGRLLWESTDFLTEGTSSSHTPLV